MSKTIYVVDGARTPFLKAQKGPGVFAASDLATQAGRALLCVCAAGRWVAPSEQGLAAAPPPHRAWRVAPCRPC